MRGNTLLFAALAVVQFSGFFTSCAAGAALHTVALTGDRAPGTESDAYFSRFRFEAPILNNEGHTAFTAVLTLPGGSGADRSSVWSDGGGAGLRLVAETGKRVAAEGSDFVFFQGSRSPVIDGAGQTGGRAFLSGPRVNKGNDTVIWSEVNDGGLALVAREGSHAPGAEADVRFADFAFDLPVLSSTGLLAFGAGLAGNDGTLFGRGIWRGNAEEGLNLVAKTGDPAPGTEQGVQFSSLTAWPVLLNNAGQTAFAGGVSGPGVDESNKLGIWSEGGGNGLVLLARAGDPAPGSDGEKFLGFHAPLTLNDNGQTAIRGLLSDSEGNDRSGFGIWSGGGATELSLVARNGNQAPDVEAGTAFLSFGDPVIDQVGRTAFVGYLTGPGLSESNHEGIWSEGGGAGLTLIARTGSPAPGTDVGVQFAQFGHDTPLVLNSMGRIAFYGLTTDRRSRGGIWAQDEHGVLQLIVREGQQIDVNNDPNVEDLRTIRLLWLRANTVKGGRRGTGFNDRGQVAFRAEFRDGSSGIFVSNLVAVPEPSSGCLLLGVSLLLATRRS